MTPPEFKAWRKRYDLTKDEAADRLGISIGDVERYERGGSGLSSIPSTIAHACASFDRKQAVKSKINERIRAGAPGHITPDVLREILLEMIDAV